MGCKTSSIHCRGSPLIRLYIGFIQDVFSSNRFIRGSEVSGLSTNRLRLRVEGGEILIAHRNGQHSC